jgi:hypothetical protein
MAYGDNTYAKILANKNKYSVAQKGRAGIAQRDALEYWTSAYNNINAATYDKDIAMRDMQRGLNNNAIERGDARGSYVDDAKKEETESVMERYRRAIQGIEGNITGYENSLLAAKYKGGGGGGGSKPRYPAPPAPVNTGYVAKATPAGTSPSLYQAVQTGTVPLQAAAAYVGAPKAQAAAAKPVSPYDWWRNNH